MYLSNSPLYLLKSLFKVVHNIEGSRNKEQEGWVFQYHNQALGYFTEEVLLVRVLTAFMHIHQKHSSIGSSSSMDALVWKPESIHSQIIKSMCTKLHKLYQDGTVEILLLYFKSIFFLPICFVLLCWNPIKLLAPTHLLQTLESYNQ